MPNQRDATRLAPAAVALNASVYYTGIGMALMLTAPPPAPGRYLYEAVPVWFFVALALPAVAVLFLTWRQRTSVGPLITVLVIQQCTFLVVPYLLGHTFVGGADALTHIGVTRDVISSGTLQRSTVYPAPYVWFAQAAILLGVQFSGIAMTLLPCVLYILFVTGIIAFLKRLRSLECIGPVVVLACGFVLQFPTFYHSTIPFGVAMMMFPFAAHSGYRSLLTTRARRGWHVLTLVLALFLVATHVLVAFAWICFVAATIWSMRGRLGWGTGHGLVYAGGFIALCLVLGAWLTFTPTVGEIFSRAWTVLTTSPPASQSLTLGSGLAMLGGPVAAGGYFVATFGASAAVVALPLAMLVVQPKSMRGSPFWWFWLAMFAIIAVLAILPAPLAAHLRTINFAFRFVGFLVIASLLVSIRFDFRHWLRPAYGMAFAIFIASWLVVYPSPAQRAVTVALTATPIAVANWLSIKHEPGAIYHELASEYWYRLVQYAVGAREADERGPSRYRNWQTAPDDLALPRGALLVYMPQTIDAYNGIWEGAGRYPMSRFNDVVASQSVVYAVGADCRSDTCIVAF